MYTMTVNEIIKLAVSMLAFQ